MANVVEIDEAAEGAVDKQSFFMKDSWLYGFMAVMSAAALTVSFWLSYDDRVLQKDPSKGLICDVNAVISCGKVAQTWQAEVLRFMPNAWLGILFESVVLCVAIAGLLGTKFSKIFMALLHIFYTVALIFALWLFSQSYFVIHIFCPLCLVITVTTILEWFSILRINVRDKGLYMAQGIRSKLESYVNNNWDIFTAFIIIVILAAMIVLKYGSKLFA